MEKKETASKLIELRKKRGLSQEQLSTQSGVALRTIQRIEAASVQPHLQTLSLLATALDSDVNEFTVSGEPEADLSKRKWLVVLHLTPIIGSFFPSGNLLVPFGCWLYKRNDDREFDSHGKTVINFQLSMSIVLAIAFILIFTATPAGIILLFSSISYNVIMVLINSWKVSQNKSFTYPLSIRFLKRPALLLFAALFISFLGTYLPVANAQQIKRIDGSAIAATSLQRNITLLMDSAQVTGLEVAIFNSNKLVYKKAFGKGNDANVPLHTSMNMYGASLSKAVFAVLVMKLVEEGVIDLDKPLQSYLPKPIYDYPKKTKWQDNYDDLRADTLYRKITARMCLNHTTGFPNWRWDNPDQKLAIALSPGSRYSYSGEGMVYLQTVIERITGKSLEQLMQEKIFIPFNMKNSAYTWLPRFESDYALGYNKDGKSYEKDKDNEARAPSTLETTLDDYAQFIQAILTGKALKKQSRLEMLRPQIRLRSVSQMGPLSRKDTSANEPISLSYGLGWGLLKSPYGWAAFKEGHGDGFQHYSIIFPDLGIGMVILANSDNAESIFKDLLEIAIADKYTPWKWQNYIPYNYSSIRE